MNVGGKAEDEDDPVMRKTNFSCSIICICMKHLQHFFLIFRGKSHGREADERAEGAN